MNSYYHLIKQGNIHLPIIQNNKGNLFDYIFKINHNHWRLKQWLSNSLSFNIINLNY